jgi:hypothetical protein
LPQLMKSYNMASWPIYLPSSFPWPLFLQPQCPVVTFWIMSEITAEPQVFVRLAPYSSHHLQCFLGSSHFLVTSLLFIACRLLLSGFFSTCLCMQALLSIAYFPSLW